MQPVTHVLSPCHHFEGGFNQSAAYNLPSFQAQSDNFEVICRTASDQDCRRHVATQIKARDWRLTTLTRATVLNEEFDLGNTWAGMSDNEKDPAPSATPGAIHRGVGYASMANEDSVCWEHEGIVGELHGRQCLCVQHQFERFDPITCRRGDTGGGGGRGRPYPYPSHDHSCSNGK